MPALQCKYDGAKLADVCQLMKYFDFRYAAITDDLTIFATKYTVMAKETERKFLVRDTTFMQQCDEKVEIRQAYLNDNPVATVRVRLFGDKAYLTVKSKNKGIERHEWEYEIPVEDAEEMLSECHTSGMIEKTRYRCGRWEIDVFHGRLSGLIIAEIELECTEECVEIPPFAGREVSDDCRYYNSALATADEMPPVE